jgi:hypothetical protein
MSGGQFQLLKLYPEQPLGQVYRQEWILAFHCKAPVRNAMGSRIRAEYFLRGSEKNRYKKTSRRSFSEGMKMETVYW